MEINGIAHIQITAGNFARSREFYRQLLPFLGLKQVMDDATGGFYCVGGRTGFLVSPPAPEHDGERFVQRRVGLHHVCFRARSKEDIDEAYRFVLEGYVAGTVAWAAKHGPPPGSEGCKVPLRILREFKL